MSEQKRAKPKTFTDLFIQKIPYSDTPAYYWDSALPAFGIRVGKTRKTFTVIRGTRRERLSIGVYPAISLMEARKTAKGLLIAKPRSHASRLISEALDDFIKMHCDKLKCG